MGAIPSEGAKVFPRYNSTSYSSFQDQLISIFLIQKKCHFYTEKRFREHELLVKIEACFEDLVVLCSLRYFSSLKIFAALGLPQNT